MPRAIWTGAETPDKTGAPDLMAALKASLEGGSPNGGLGDLSKGELYERAKKADVKGRADMSKDELVAALSG